MKIILASNSPRRKELLHRDGYEFEVIPSTVDEVLDESLKPVENVKSLAKQKCLDVAKSHYDDVVIGADTIVVFDNKIFGKPKTDLEAYQMLNALQGKSHEVMTGVCVCYKNTIINEAEFSQVIFKAMSDEDIWDYIKTKEPCDKAGAYAIQGIGKKYIESYKGSFDNIVGLPMEMLNKILKSIE